MSTKYNKTSLKQLLSQLFKLHQEIKQDFLKECGKRRTGDNNYTLKWLKKRDNSEIKLILKNISNIIKLNDPRANYKIIREIYLISPSLHENWFFNDHVFRCFKKITKHRLGLKAYLTSKKNGSLGQNIKRITSYVLKNTILLENLTSAKLNQSLMDDNQPFSRNIENDIHTLIKISENKSITIEKILQSIPILFGVVHYLTKTCDYIQLKSDVLIKNWLEYAPCSINEGPIFIPNTEKDLIEILSSVPALNEKMIRNHLRKYFIVKEYII